MTDVGWSLTWVQKLEGTEESANEGEVDERPPESARLFHSGRDVRCVAWPGRSFSFTIMYVEESNRW